MSWTDERIDTLRRLWEQGLTASQIADDLGNVTRNAVIGKAHRLGLKSRPSPVKAGDDGAAAASPAASVAPPPAPRPAPPRPVVKPLADAPKPVSAPRPPSVMAPTATTVSSAPASTGDDNDRARPTAAAAKSDEQRTDTARTDAPRPDAPRMVSIGPGGFIRQGPGDQQAPIPPAPPRRRVPAKPSADIASKTGLLDLNDRICRWPMGHPGEADFHFCGVAVNPGYPYCVDHCGRAFQAQLPRGTRRPPPPPPFGGTRVR